MCVESLQVSFTTPSMVIMCVVGGREGSGGWNGKKWNGKESGICGKGKGKWNVKEKIMMEKEKSGMIKKKKVGKEMEGKRKREE